MSLPNITLPDIIEELDYETLLEDTEQNLRDKTNLDIEFIESDPVSMANESLVYREMLMRARINKSARAAYLFTATGNDLENYAAGRGVIRLEDENDERLRYRTWLALYSFSTAGAAKSYEYHALSVSNDILQARCLGPKDGTAAGTVEIVYHSASDFSEAIETACNADEVVPLCDTALVSPANVIVTEIIISALELEDGYMIADVRTRINAVFESLNATLSIGESVAVSRIYDLSSVVGVKKVVHNIEEDVVATVRDLIQFTITYI